MKSHIFLLLAFVLHHVTAMAQTPDGTPLKLRVATFNVGHFNQGVAGGLEVRGEAVYGKEGKQRYAQMEMLAWRDWISRQSLDIIGVQEWNTYFDADSTVHAEEELLKPFYKNVYFGDGHKWIFNGIATNYTLTICVSNIGPGSIMP